jgi:hypothetical protein
MPIVHPKSRRVVCHDHEDYNVPVAILDEKMLTMDDEELMQAMARYKPRTRFKEGDFVILTEIPDHLRWRETLPRCWKVRFVVTYWSYNLMCITQSGGAVTLSQAINILENHKALHGATEFRKPMIYAHGYPHGEYPDTAAWLPEAMLRRTVFKETTSPWQDIVEEARAPYLGYDTDKVPTRFVLEYAPRNYRSGENLQRPFIAEEPLVNTLYFAGLEEMLEVPYVIGEQDRVARIDEDHDIYIVDEDDKR